MRRDANDRWISADRHGRLLTACIALVFGLSAATVGTGWIDGSEPAEAAVALAVTDDPSPAADLDPPRALDPLQGIVVEVPVRSDLDPSVVLPTPEPSPANAYAPTPVVEHGTLEIPAIGLSQTLFEGVTLTAINRGPSHWPGTAMPGEVGNVVVAGHRTTYSKPFYLLDELVPGDELIFTIGAERIVYELDRIEIVAPDDIHIIDQTNENRATLFACHPRGSARQRIVGHFTQRPDTVAIDLPDLGGLARRQLDF